MNRGAYPEKLSTKGANMTDYCLLCDKPIQESENWQWEESTGEACHTSCLDNPPDLCDSFRVTPSPDVPYSWEAGEEGLILFIG